MTFWDAAGAVGAIVFVVVGFLLAAIAYCRLAAWVEAWWRDRRARLVASGPEMAVAQEQRATELLYPPSDWGRA